MDVRRVFARVTAVAGSMVVVAATLTTGAASAAASPATVTSGSPLLNTGQHTITVTTTNTYLSPPAPAPTVTISRTGNANDTVAATAVVGSGGTSKSITISADFTAANPGPYDIDIHQIQSQGPVSVPIEDACTSCVSVQGFTPVVANVSPSALAEGTKSNNSTNVGYQNFLINGQSFAKGQYISCAGTISDCATLGTSGSPNVAIRQTVTGLADGNVSLRKVAGSGETDAGASGVAGTLTQIALRINVTAGSETAPYFDDVTVTNSDGKHNTCVSCLEIFPAPTIDSVKLLATGGNTIGRNATGQTLVISGHNFQPTTNSVTLAPAAGQATPGSMSFSSVAVSNDGTKVTVSGVNTTAVTATGINNWSATVSDATLHSVTNAGSFVVTDAPAPTGVHYISNPATTPLNYGQGAQGVSMTIDVGATNGFTAGSGDPSTYTHAILTGLPSGVTITGEEADAGTPSTVKETFNVDPGASLGSATIKLVNPDGGTSTSSCTATGCALTIVAAPKVSTLSPASFLAGTTNGSLVLTGTNIDAGTQHVSITVGNTNFVTGTGNFNHGTGAAANQITVTGITVPGGEPAEDADVTLINNDNNGVSVCVKCFHVTSVDVTSVVPSAATGATNDAPSPITINGDNFASDAAFSLQQVGVPTIPVTGASVTNPGANGSQATGTVDLTGVAPGFYDVVAANPSNNIHAGTGVCVQCFRVLASAPTASNVSPNKAGGGASNLAVTLTGTNIFPGAQMSFSSADITLVGDPVIASDHKSITQHISVAPNAGSEVGSVTVFNTDGQHPGSPLTFTVDPAPVVNTIAPSAHANGTSFPLTITGSGFSASPLPTVTFSNAGVTGTVQSVSNAGDSITVSTTIANNVASSTPVAVHVTVTNPDQGFALSPTDLTVDPQPTFDHVTPDTVAAGASVPQLQIFGAGFLSGATVAPHSANSGLTFGTVTVASPTEIDVPLTVDSAAAKGARTIDVGNPDGGATTASLTVITVPSVPQTVTATGGARAVTVDWAAPSDNGGSALTSYTVTLAKQGSPTTAASFTTSDAGTLEHTFTQVGSPAANLENNTTYVAQVVATNAAGNSAAAPANGATATTYALPKAPSSLTATGGVRTVDLSWPAVTDAGNDPAGIASYTVTLVKRGADPNTTQTFTTPDGSTLSHQFTGLVNGSTYDATVRATNAAGDSSTTGASAATFDVPSAPGNINAVPADGTLAVTWDAPSSTGGTPVTGYTVTLTPSGGDSPATTTSTQHTFTGLTNDQSYTVSIVATNAAGDSQAATTNGTPVPAPPAPAPVSAAPGNGTLDVTWTAPTTSAGHAVSSYQATIVRHDGVGSPMTFTSNASDAGGLVTEHVFSGLVNGKLYDVAVTATNDIGTGPAASTSGTPRTTAQAPTGVTAVAGDAKATVSWTAPADSGGVPVTHYVVTANPGNHQVTTADGTTTQAVVTGLTNGTTYTITVLAQNVAGDGASSASVPATPKFVTTETVATSKPSVSYGTKITLSGQLLRSNSAPIVGASVLVFRVPDVGGTAHIATVKTNSAGRWSYTFAPGLNASYYARFLGDGADASSGSTKVRTLVAVVIRTTSPANNSRSSISAPLAVKGSVTPNKYGAKVTLYYVKSTGQLVALATTTVSKTSTYAFSVKLGKGTWHLRVTIGSTTNNIGARTSVLTVSRV
ncbi:MAG: trimeric autotransporter adhesin [Frankiaceae bacterium]|jgi:hypothetical protein|nr:trimeric autotransporter adhesin [Frankiaceae bacterium]